MPINDQQMTYDPIFHRYILNVKFASTYLGVNLTQIYNEEAGAKSILNAISRRTYQYVYRNNAISNRNFVEYMLALDETLRPAIMEAMLAQLEADISSGYNDLINSPGINIESGGVIDEQTMAERALCIDARSILENGNGCFNLMYAADYGVRLAVDRYTKYGY